MVEAAGWEVAMPRICTETPDELPRPVKDYNIDDVYALSLTNEKCQTRITEVEKEWTLAKKDGDRGRFEVIASRVLAELNDNYFASVLWYEEGMYKRSYGRRTLMSILRADIYRKTFAYWIEQLQV